MDDHLAMLALWSVSTLAVLVTFVLLIWGAIEDGRTERRHRLS